PHLRGGIVQQEGQRGLGCAAVLEGQVCIHIGPGQGGSGCRALRDFRRVDPFQEMRNYHTRSTPGQNRSGPGGNGNRKKVYERFTIFVEVLETMTMRRVPPCRISRQRLSTLQREANMPGLYLEEFTVGQVFRHPLRRTVTESDNVLFSVMTLNPQPLHIDFDFAARTEWGKPLVNSLFTLGLMIGISVND